MAWTYSLSGIETSQKDQLRLLIGDVYAPDPQMQDEEILHFLSMRSSIYGAAAEACRALASKFSRSVDVLAAGTGAKFGQLSKAYALMAAQFETKAASGGGVLPFAGGISTLVPYAGGISRVDKERQEQDTDRVRPQFNLGMMDDLVPNTPPAHETEGD